MNFTEGLIQTCCWSKWQQQCHVLIPNYTPAGWFEADLWRINRSGLCVEYEIKVSRADFRGDQKKEDRHAWRGLRESNKHARLQLGDERGPNQFYFVAPEGVIPPEEIPEFAGLFEVQGDPLWPRLKLRRNAPYLHRVKNDQPLDKIGRSLYFRYWQVRNKLPKKANLTEEQMDFLLKKDLQGSQRTRALEQLVVAQSRQIELLTQAPPQAKKRR